jgi:hypothetical protein
VKNVNYETENRKIITFWNVTPCNLALTNVSEEPTQHQTAQHRIPEDGNLTYRKRKKLDDSLGAYKRRRFGNTGIKLLQSA